MTRAFGRSDRIGQVERLLLTSRIPLSKAEIARRCEVHRATIGRMVQSMIDAGIPVRTTEDDLLYIERTDYLSTVHLKLHEALAVFLACRMLARYSDKPNTHTVAALEKLGASLHKAMPQLSHHIGSTTQTLRGRLPNQASLHQRALERLTEAWARGVKVQLWYRPLSASRAFQHTFAPFFLEPSAIGYSTYVLGLAEPPGQLRTRKLERIERVELSEEPFEVPPGFDPNALLAGAWGIWFDEGDRPTAVRLRFSGAQAIRRVGETVWHPSQRTQTDAEGRLVWTAEIDEPHEMLPWVRGWGPSCEVLAPPALRERVASELRRQLLLYGPPQQADPADALVAHTPPPGSDHWHLLVEHLREVAAMARTFAQPFGAGYLAELLGLWHDIGKSSPAFQAYLRRCHNDPRHKGSGPDHKAAGAILAERAIPPLALLAQGHHGGLKTSTDYGTWLAACRKDNLEPDRTTPSADAAIARMQALLPEIAPAEQPELPAWLDRNDRRAAEFFLRMLFSALVDADFLDTERHFTPAKAERRSADVPIERLLARFEADQRTFVAGRAPGPMNEARDALYQHCLAAAEQPPGLFRLAIPTGGAKTRSGMAFALRHAARHGLCRVIVAVPFISITEQTADVYRRIFQEEGEVVLEHHSGVAGNEGTDYSPRERWRRLASENWDAPIVVTTTVQLFESLFANGTARCRKLHRLAGSVIILDEAQALPTGLLTPILDAIKQLCAHYGATVVLSTATQPAFESIPLFASLQARDIVPDAARWFGALKRVDYDWRLDRPLDWGEVAGLMRAEPQALAVVNTKKDALALLDALGDDPAAAHLSTLLCGAHRRTVIAEVRERLKAGLPCRLVSTQVIEAGVDLDFPLGLRAAGPLDRVIQTAGRCNREGRQARGRVIVFEPAEGGMPPGPYRTGANVTRSLLRDADFDPDQPEHVRRYFERLFQRVELDRDVQKLREAWNFPGVAAAFRMIEEETESVIVTTYGDAAAREQVQDDIELLRQEAGPAREVLRRLQPFCVSLPVRVADGYRKSGLVEELLPGVGIWRGRYDAVRGLVPDDDRALMIV
ncbi:MAG TPA: CRISPR-associated endonuclease Cas3'' [Roseiflexaceae bacterium]|nr:CRISPR-associated endonuclease Cas3'' [Roseiflexaceae bacterium]